MKIKSLHKEYIQKSRLFCYPLLNIKRGSSITPIQTFMAFENVYDFSDKKFICQYHMRNDQEFIMFQNIKLRQNPLFHEFHLLNDGTGLYVFDLSKIHNDFEHIINGKYSALSKQSKDKISNFFSNSNVHYVYIASYLEPQKYYNLYSELLNVDIKHIKACGELCSKPDLKLETKSFEKTMNESDNLLNLPIQTNN